MDIFVSPTSANRPPVDNSCQSHPVPQTTSPPSVDWQTPLSKLIATAADSENRLHKHIPNIIKHYQTRLCTKKFIRTNYVYYYYYYFFTHIIPTFIITYTFMGTRIIIITMHSGR